MPGTSRASHPRAQKPDAWLQLCEAESRVFLFFFPSLEVPWTKGAGGPCRTSPLLTETTVGHHLSSGRCLNSPSAGRSCSPLLHSPRDPELGQKPVWAACCKDSRQVLGPGLDFLQRQRTGRSFKAKSSVFRIGPFITECNILQIAPLSRFQHFPGRTQWKYSLAFVCVS